MNHCFGQNFNFFFALQHFFSSYFLIFSHPLFSAQLPSLRSSISILWNSIFPPSICSVQWNFVVLFVTQHVPCAHTHISQNSACDSHKKNSTELKYPERYPNFLLFGHTSEISTEFSIHLCVTFFLLFTKTTLLFALFCDFSPYHWPLWCETLALHSVMYHLQR